MHSLPTQGEEPGSYPLFMSMYVTIYSKHVFKHMHCVYYPCMCLMMLHNDEVARHSKRAVRIFEATSYPQLLYYTCLIHESMTDRNAL